VQSNRYQYWRVAVATWADHPLAGAGSGAFAVEWLRRRTVAASARDAHSLPLETAAELGLAGLLALGLLVAGVIAALVRLQRVARGVAAAGGLAAWSVHATLDWAWEMPSVTLLAVLLAAAVIGAAEEPQRGSEAR
jgi:O-antigen ligase